jgi:hypothetical protein
VREHDHRWGGLSLMCVAKCIIDQWVFLLALPLRCNFISEFVVSSADRK